MSETPRTDAVWNAEWAEYKKHGLNSPAQGLFDHGCDLERELSAALARVKELEKDGERYRWLRDRSRREDRDGGWTGIYTTFPTPAWDDTPYSKERGKGYHYETMDAAIDASLAAHQEK